MFAISLRRVLPPSVAETKTKNSLLSSEDFFSEPTLSLRL